MGHTNDENMLAIQGDEELAHIYLGEFMRLFSHYAFRESLSFRDNRSEAAALVRKYLVPSTNGSTAKDPAPAILPKAPTAH